MLGAVELGVRGLDQFGAGHAGLEGGGAEAHGHADFAFVEAEDGLFHRDPHGFAQAFHLGGFQLGEHEAEFLAAVAGEELLPAHARGDGAREPREHFVPGQVAEAVVHLLEVVNVEHHGGQRRAVARGAGELPVQEIHQVAFVGDLGEAVAHGELVDLLVEERLDVAARKVLEDGAPHLHEIAVPQRRAGLDLRAVHLGAVGAAEILHGPGLAFGREAGVLPGDIVQVQHEVVGSAAPDGQLAPQGMAASQFARAVEQHEAGRLRQGRRHGNGGAGDIFAHGGVWMLTGLGRVGYGPWSQGRRKKQKAPESRGLLGCSDLLSSRVPRF